MHQKSKLLLLLLVLASLALSACTIQISTAFNPDGSGEWRTEMGISDEEAQLLTGSGTASSTEQFCNDMLTGGELPEGVTDSFEEREDGDWCVFTRPFANLEELRALYIENGGVIINRLEIVDGSLFYDVTMDMGSSEDFQSISDMGVEINMTWALTLPGTITSHNATSVDGNTLTWNLTPGQDTTIVAQSVVAGGGGFPAWIWVVVCCLCLLVLAAGGAVIFFLMRKRKQDAGASGSPVM